MIQIDRGAEPPALGPVRALQLTSLRSIIRTHSRDPSSREIEGYKEPTRMTLWERQHQKCCYCEHRIEDSYNDVEHFRPKARANRQPGSSADHGYWWLAHTWENLLFACPQCNRTDKNDQFPLLPGSVPLKAEQLPPGRERVRILDPSGPINPVKHIIFEYRALIGTRKRWYAFPRAGSDLGLWSIKVYGLNRWGILEIRDKHVQCNVQRQVDTLKGAIDDGGVRQVKRAFDAAIGMLTAKNEFVALSYDAFRARVPAPLLAPFRLVWPEPEDIAMR